MIRTILILAVLTLISSAATPHRASASSQLATATIPAQAVFSDNFLDSLGLTSHATPTQKECCKICTRGKACGDTCIARDKICHQAPGCACDG